MAQNTILAAAQTAAMSTDVTLLAGESATVGIFSSSKIPEPVQLSVLIDTPGRNAVLTKLSARNPAVVLSGPGTFRVSRPAITAFGVNVGAFHEDGASS